VTGVLLAGIGHLNEHQKKNFLVVDSSTSPVFQVEEHYLTTGVSLETQISTIESAFQDFTERKDIAILLINQDVRTLWNDRCVY
jgi:V-type H+-transporting ATPase subunit F